jgi:hypothetical protein
MRKGNWETYKRKTDIKGHNKIWEIMNQKISINNEMTQHFPIKHNEQRWLL